MAEPEDLTLRLSDEVLVQVFVHLPIRELLFPVRGVCTRWRRVALDRVCWRGRGVSVGFPDDQPPQLATRALQVAPCLRSLRLKTTRLRRPPWLATPDERDVTMELQDALLANRCRVSELHLTIKRWREVVPFLGALPLLTRDLERLALELPDAVGAGQNILLLQLALSGKRLQRLRLHCPSLRSAGSVMDEDSILQGPEVTAALKGLELSNVDVEVTKRLLRLNSATLEIVALLGLNHGEAAALVGVLPACEKLTCLNIQSRPISDPYRSALLDYFQSPSAARLKTLRLELYWNRNKGQSLTLEEDVLFFPILLLEAVASFPDVASLEELYITYVGLNTPSNPDDYAFRLVQVLAALRHLSVLRLNPNSDPLDKAFFDCMSVALTNHLHVIDLRLAVRCCCSDEQCLIPALRRVVRGCHSMHIIGVRFSRKCRDDPLRRCLFSIERLPHRKPLYAERPPRLKDCVFGFYAHNKELDCYVCKAYQDTVVWLSVGW